MKRIFYIISLCLLVCNVVVTNYIFKEYRFDIDFNLLLKFYYEGNIYSLKIGVLAVVIDWLSKDWINKKDINE